jgi:malonyl CoA-acyl carrier protein transacylase
MTVALAKAMKFRVKEGEHNVVISGPEETITRFRRYVKDQVIKSRTDLCEIFPNKFERVFDDVAVANEEDFVGVDSSLATAGSQLAVDELDTAVAVLDEKATVNPAEGWIEVTDKFPRAIKAGVDIWQNGNNFNIVSGDGVILNDKPLNRLNVNKTLSRL